METLHLGDALEVLRSFPDQQFHCCVTSPPYWGLRDYGLENQVGLESDPELYVLKLVLIFNEVRRVLRDDATLWLNLGDSYVSGKSRYSSKPQTMTGRNRNEPAAGNRPDLHGHPVLKDKDLCGIPWRVALALQKAGWWLRNDIIWDKPNCLPESVKDRLTKSHEYIFLLTKSARYYFDQDAIREENQLESKKRALRGQKTNKYQSRTPLPPGVHPNTMSQAREYVGYERMDELVESGATLLNPKGRNCRDVWRIPTANYSGGHFATFPLEIPRRAIKAGCPPGGTVLDPFCGSGTTGVACLELGRDFVGIDLNAEYLQMAQQRLDAARRTNER